MKRFFTFLIMLTSILTASAVTYTVAGSAAVLNGSASWAETNADNDMVSTDNVNYTLTISGVNVEAGTYEYKVVQDHSWSNNWPSQNAQLAIGENAKYDIVYSFNTDTKDVSAVATRIGDFEGSTDKTYTVVGAEAVLGTSWDLNNLSNDMTKGDDGLYRLVKVGVALTAGTSYEYKIAVNHDWGTSYPAQNASFSVTADGNYDVTFVFNETTKEPSATAEAASAGTAAVFDFENNPQNWPVGEGVNFADGNLTAPLVVGEVTLTGVQGDAKQPARIMRGNDGVSALYVYKGGSFKLAAAEGRALTKVEVTMMSGSFDLTASNGTIENDVWTGNATEVLFTSSATRKILKLVVTTADKNGDTIEPVQETFDVEASDIAAFKAVEDGKLVKLLLNNARVNAYNDLFSNYYLEDATGAVMLTGVSSTLKAGDQLNGYIIGKKSSSALDWSGDHPDYIEYTLAATSDDKMTVTEGQLTGTVVAVAAVADAINHGRLLTVENVTIQKEGRFYYACSGEDKVQVKDELGVLPLDYEWPTTAVDVTGVATFNGVRWQLAPVTAEGITSHSADTTSAIIDFANNNLELPVGSNGEHSEDGNLAGKVLNLGNANLTFVNSPTMPTRYYNTKRGNHFQMIKGGQMRITAAEGLAVVAVRCTPNYTTNASTGATVSNISWTVDKGDGTLSDDLLSWTGNAASVRFSATGATYLDAIEVVTAPVTAETITPEADVYTDVATLADFAALADGTLARIQLTDAVVTATALGPSRWTIYIQDATAGAHMYCMPFTLETGYILNGVLYGVKSVQNAGPRIAMAELTMKEGQLMVDEGGSVDPLTGTIAELSVAANLNRVVKLQGVSFAGTKATEGTATDAEGTTITINNASSGMSPYVITDSFEGVSYGSATITGILYGTNKGINLYPLSIAEDVADGITTVNTNDKNFVIYNLQGQRRQQLTKGINIVGGKKILVK